MKVLFFTNLPVPYRMKFFNELGKYCDLTVMVENEKRVNSNSNWLKDYKIDNYTYYALPIKSFFKRININYGYKKIIKKEKYDVIIVGSYYSISAMIFIEFLRKNKIKYILNADGGFVKNDNIFKYALKKHFISKANAYLSTGNKTNEYLIYYGAKKEKIYRYPFTSVNEKDMLKQVIGEEEKEKIRNLLGIREKKVLLSVGSFIYRKGYDILLNACKDIDKEIGIYIVGWKPTDDCVEEYKKLKKDLNLYNVHFIDFLTKDQLSLYYKCADVFVLPTREDVWGLVINEAMAYGLPVITTNRCIAGVELIKNGENGFLIEINDVEELRKKINFLFSKDYKKKQMSLNALKTIREYSIENMAKVHYKIIKEVTANKK